MPTLYPPLTNEDESVLTHVRTMFPHSPVGNIEMAIRHLDLARYMPYWDLVSMQERCQIHENLRDAIKASLDARARILRVY